MAGTAWPARLHPGQRRREPGLDPGERTLPGGGVAQRRGAVDAAAELALIKRHQRGQALSQRGERGGQGCGLHSGIQDTARMAGKVLKI